MKLYQKYHKFVAVLLLRVHTSQQTSLSAMLERNSATFWLLLHNSLACSSMQLDLMHNLSCAFLHAHDWEEHCLQLVILHFLIGLCYCGAHSGLRKQLQTHLVVEACKLLTHLTSFIPRPHSRGESLVRSS